MFQHSLASTVLRRTRTAVTAAALALATVGPVVALATPAHASGPTTFSNATALTVADATPPCVTGCTPGLASSYPSPITVSGMSGTLSNMTVTLTGVTHAFTSDFDVLLTGPAGQKFVLASDAGNNGGSSGATVTFSDAASGVPSLSGGWGNGTQTYKPFNYNGDPDVWPSPAPAGPYSDADTGTSGSGSLDTTSFASVFNGTNPNGTWNLYVVDDGFGDTGSISGGWSMSLTTAAAAATLTTVTTSGSPVSTGASLTLTAHVVQSSDSSNVTAGTVTFSDGASALGGPVAVDGSGMASLVTSSLTEGTHLITAAYTGNASFGNSSGSVSQVVDHPTSQVGSSYCNTGPLTLNDATAGAAGGATPYPSHIVVSGASGALSALTVSLTGVTAADSDELDVELVGPTGQKFMLASDAGGAHAIAGANVTFDDNAAGTFASSTGGWGSGTSSSKPVDYNTGPDVMPAPAPSGWSSPAPTGAASLTSVFGGASPNGTWSLYAADDALGGAVGAVSGGWCLNTTSTTDPATTTNLTSSVNPTALGGSTTFTAHVTATSGGADVTVGTVTFRDGATVLGSAQALTGTGTASVATAALTEGSHTITATYSGVGGSFNLSTASLTQTVNGVTTVTANTFCNNGGITVNDPPGAGAVGPASPYGSHIVVSGITGNLSNLTVGLKGVTHAAPDDLDVLLVGPGGQSLKLASDAGGLVPISGVNATFDDAAASSLPDSTSWGTGSITVKPTDFNDGTDTFPSPAPAPAYGTPAPAGSATLNGTFDGTSPDGTWNLYVVDDSLGQTGSMTGWCLTLGIPAVAVADGYTAGMNIPLTVAAPGVLSNDSGFPAPTVTASDTVSAQGGTVAVGADGHFTYTPPAGFTGQDSFHYTAGNGVTSATTVTIDVTNVPVVAGATLSRQQGTATSTSTVATVSDVETPAGSLMIATGSSTGINLAGVANTAGTVTGSVGASCTAALGAHTLSVDATDSDNFTGHGTLTVNVSANTPPVLSYGSLAADVTTGTTGDPLTGPSDNGTVSTLAVQSVSAGFTGTVTVDGPLSGTPGRLHVSNAAPSGSYTVTVRGTDNCGTTTDVPVTLTVNGPPVVFAGGDDTITLPADATLAGSASDDGLAPGTGLVTTWSQFSGPGTASFADVHSPTSTVSFDQPGVYVLKLSATDGSLTTSDQVQITVRAVPVITVPDDFSVGEASPGAGADVTFSVTATGFPTPTISCLDGVTPVASGDHFTTGTHTILCTATNGAGSDHGSFQLSVNAGPVITVPSDITVNETVPGAGAVVTFSVTATGVPTPDIVCTDDGNPVSSGDTFAVGEHSIGCTASNSQGTASAGFLITVQSTPVLTVPAAFTVTESPIGSGTASVPFTVTAAGFPTPVTVCKIAATPVVSPVLLAIGAHQIDCTATNVVGTASKSFTVTVAPGNHAPLAQAGGPYSVTEGHSLSLSGAGSSDADGDALTYTWDVNGDGVFGDATGVAPTLTWAQLGALGITDGPSTHPVKVRVSDGKAAPVVSGSATLTVVNAAPVATIAAAPYGTSGLTVTLAFGGSDPSATDQAAGFGYLIHWGDGTSSGPLHGGTSLTRAHTYATAGGYTVTVTVTDKDGAVSPSVSKQLTLVALVKDVCGTGKTLVVGGTAGNDVITIKPGATSHLLNVVVNGVTEAVATGFTRVVVVAGAGDDKVTFSGGTHVERIVYGGAGNDTLVAGNGPAVLVGGAGKDVLKGGTGRDVLIGGAGSDAENGGSGEDILIDGATSVDAFTTATEKVLCGIQAEWTRTGVSFAGRVAHLLGAPGSRSATNIVISGKHRNVFSGGDKDVLDGGGGATWFLANVKGKGVLDTLLHRSPKDTVTDL